MGGHGRLTTARLTTARLTTARLSKSVKDLAAAIPGHADLDQGAWIVRGTELATAEPVVVLHGLSNLRDLGVVNRVIVIIDDAADDTINHALTSLNTAFPNKIVLAY